MWIFKSAVQIINRSLLEQQRYFAKYRNFGRNIDAATAPIGLDIFFVDKRPNFMFKRPFSLVC